jgi:predicted nuclease of predicted toxin-antitoxin system
MKLLIDENISWRIIKKIENDFDAIHVSTLKIKQPTNDREIWKYAFENNFTIVSIDDDFEKLVTYYNSPPKLIALKINNLKTQEVANLLILNKIVIEEFINKGADGILMIYS